MATWPPPPFDPDVTRRIVLEFADVPGPVLLALQAIQEEFGYVDTAALSIMADVLNVSRAEVYGVLSYYPDLRMKPPTRGLLRVCVAEGCQANGSRELVQAATESLGIEVGGSTPDGITLEGVYCLGNCFLGPNISVDGRIVGAVTPEMLASRIEALRELMASP